jgi:hypothetical protein
MKNPPSPAPDIQALLESADPVASEPMPAGWSRRNWVQREAVALGALVIADPDLEPAAE